MWRSRKSSNSPALASNYLRYIARSRDKVWVAKVSVMHSVGASGGGLPVSLSSSRFLAKDKSFARSAPA